MSDFMPTTEDVIRKYATGATWQHQSFAAAEDEIRRWLAAHDAEKRAEWEAEQGEVEWEYGVLRHDVVMVNNGSYTTQQTHHRRKAGPWVPVNENGSER